MPPTRRNAPPTHFPLRAEILGNPHGRAGTRIWVDVRLTNLGEHGFRFPYCPRVVENIGGGTRAYRSRSPLNCRGLKTLAPDHSLVFRMPVWIHPKLKVGLHQLGWGIRTTEEGQFGDDVYTTTPLVVDR